mgnify:CR=1 FL=1
MTEDTTIRISNEFASVEVSKVETKRGERLEIRSPRSGHSIRVDALGLESLCWQSPEIFSEFIGEPESSLRPGEHE